MNWGNEIKGALRTPEAIAMYLRLRLSRLIALALFAAALTLLPTAAISVTLTASEKRRTVTFEMRTLSFRVAMMTIP